MIHAKNTFMAFFIRMCHQFFFTQSVLPTKDTKSKVSGNFLLIVLKKLGAVF